MKILIRQRNHSTLQFVAPASKLPVVAAEEWVFFFNLLKVFIAQNFSVQTYT
jgi:hypothetical protein